MLLVVSGSLVMSAQAQTALPLVHQSDLVYMGAFRLPQTSSDQVTFNYGGAGVAYNSANNSLFIIGRNQLSAEVTIPTIVNSTNLSSLQTATFIQQFVDPTEGELPLINPSNNSGLTLSGQLVYNGNLYVAGYTYYDGNGSQIYSHFARPLSLSTTGQVQGPFLVGTDAHYGGGYMTLSPGEWQSALGGVALAGNCCLPITSVQSNGPSATVFDPSKLAANSGSVRVVGYPIGSPLGPGITTQNNLFNLTTAVTGVVFPKGTRSVLFFGRQGVGPYCYGPGVSDQTLAGQPADGGADTYCYDPAGSSKGTHAYPYVYQVWAYDANDLVSVKQGQKQPYQVQPYAVWAFTLPFEDPAGDNKIAGATYDPQSNVIYVSQRCVDGDCGPVIHAFKVSIGVAPMPPNNVTIH
jgi:hypothetical protein